MNSIHCGDAQRANTLAPNKLGNKHIQNLIISPADVRRYTHNFILFVMLHIFAIVYACILCAVGILFIICIAAPICAACHLRCAKTEVESDAAGNDVERGVERDVAGNDVKSGARPSPGGKQESGATAQTRNDVKMVSSTDNGNKTKELNIFAYCSKR